MYIAPMLKPLKLSGGSLYVFPSASNDIAKTFSDDDARFVFDKYVLLDLPDVKTPTNLSNDLVFESIGANPNISSIPVPPGLNSDDNFNIASAFQNYCFNFESLILSGQNDAAQPYDNSNSLTVSERVFWKFLKEMNVIRWEGATNESSTTDRFVEDKTNNFYKKVVKCIGDIDIVNSVNRESGTYTEVYIHVPTQFGNTPEVLFKTIDDSNYTPNRNWVGSGEFISGRNSSSVSPVGLSLRAWYDNDATNVYSTYTNFNTVTNTNKTVNLDGSLSTKNVSISNLDGVCIDFDVDNYSRAISNGYTRFDELNTSLASEDFSFNVVLLYYTVYSVSNPSQSSRNLYGVLFVDNFTPTTTSGSFINRINKVKPNRFTGVNGNSFGVKLNIKFDAYSESVATETSINDFSVFSMDLFADMMTKLNDANDRFLDILEVNENLRNQIIALQGALIDSANLQSFTNRLNAIETTLNNMGLIDTTSVNLLLRTINSRIDSIINGSISIQPLQLRNFLTFGGGIKLENVGNNLTKIVNTNQAFSNFAVCRNLSNHLEFVVGNGNILSTSVNNKLVLGAYTTRYKYNITNQTFIDNLVINIEDGVNGWKKGQTFRIIFDSVLDLNVYSIKINTDSENKFRNFNPYKKEIITIVNSDLFSNKPIIDITCKDESLYIFDVDIIR